jgi:hypothetical protein
MYHLEKPQRPYKNIAQYRKAMFGYNSNIAEDNPDLYPCLKCNGRGWIYDPNDEPDVVEGYKHVNHLKCPVCNGTRFGPAKLVIAQYRETINRWKKELAEYNKLLLLKKSALAKLSKDERDALSKLGVK